MPDDICYLFHVQRHYVGTEFCMHVLSLTHTVAILYIITRTAVIAAERN